ncbi:MAG: hypothetical protein LBQ68_08060 [Clostridiales bacterium]|nr:hypothetical protein [Clostridiales bacterium]
MYKQVKTILSSHADAVVPDKWDNIRGAAVGILPQQKSIVNKPRHRAYQFAALAASLCVVIAATVIAFPNLMNSGIVTDPGNLSGNPAADNSQGEKPSIPNTTKIVVNDLADGLSEPRIKIDLLEGDFTLMTKQETINYYGIDFFPKSIPADMTENTENTFGVYKRNGGTGEIYYGVNMAWYINADVSRELQVTVDKGQLPYSGLAYLGEEYEKSMINGIDLVIKRSVGYSGEVMFIAEMMYKGNGIRVYSNNLTQLEFVDAITSLLV